MMIVLVIILFLNGMFSPNVKANTHYECPQWNSQQFSKEVNALTQQIDHWDQQYYIEGISEIADPIYDQLKEQLNHWRNCLNLPETQKILPPRHAKYKVLHPVEHTGLQKLKSAHEVSIWLQKRDNVWLQPKIDGVAVTLHYRRGELISMISRGDGKQGINWIAKAPAISSIPMSIQYTKGDVVLLGEIFLKLPAHIQAQQGAMNVRSKVAGLLMQKNASPKLADLDIFIWDWPDGPNEMLERVNQLSQLGFPLTKQFTHSVNSLQQITELRDYYYQTPLPFATDGIVLKQVTLLPGAQWKKGRSSWAAAWKYPFETAVSTVKDIQFQIGRTGKITVVLLLEPIKIDNKTIRKTSIGSVKRWRDYDLLIGDSVEIILKGHGIPKVKAVVWRVNERISLPIPNADDYHQTSCFHNSLSCRQQFIARLTWLSRQLLFTGLGKASWAKLVDSGKVTSLLDWMILDEKQLISLLGNKKGVETARQFQQSKNKSFNDWLKALGIPQSKHLAHTISDWQQLKTYSNDITVQSKNKREKLHHYIDEMESQGLITILSEQSIAGF